MYRVVLLLAVLTSFLASLTASPVGACSCSPYDLSTAVEAAEYVVAGTPGPARHISNHWQAPVGREFRVDRYLKGSGPADIVVAFDICETQWADSEVLVLASDRWGLGPPPCYGPYSLAEVEAITGTGQPPDNALQEQETEGEHKDVPWVAILILAILIPLAALLVPAFLLRGGDTSRDGGE